MMKTPTTTSWTGATGVAPESTRKVVSAETSAKPTTSAPSQPETRRGGSSLRGVMRMSPVDVVNAKSELRCRGAPSPELPHSALMRRRNGVVKI